ncbi:MAG: glutaminyl-peptide cyclotransferase [Sphingobium sp.]|nr:glutaminyl-peptide cyclotransferase [Sphingobium sp.]
MKRLALLLVGWLMLTAPVRADTGWELVATYPHDSRAFTQGLIFLDGHLYESTGQYGRSEVRKVRLEDGFVLHSAPLPGTIFGEGLTHWGDKLLSLSWRGGSGFIWDRATFNQKGQFSYDGEGWGLTQDGKSLILSDGSNTLRFLDPKDYHETHSISVTWNGEPVPLLNELEYVKGEIFANVWMTDKIARINPKTGAVNSWLDLRELARQNMSSNPDAVLNGIAYDAAKDRLFVTGKLWSNLYEIRLK